jgi:hypothetical protein
MKYIISRLIIFSLLITAMWTVKHYRRAKIHGAESTTVLDKAALPVSVGVSEIGTESNATRPLSAATEKVKETQTVSVDKTCSASCSDEKSSTAAAPRPALKPVIGQNKPEIDFAQIRDSLPTHKSVQEALSRGEDIHGSPKFISASGRDIGRLMAAADKDPNNQKPAMDLLIACAEDREVVRSVRAHCYSAAVRSTRRWKLFVPMSELRVDDEIKALAARFPIKEGTSNTVSH